MNVALCSEHLNLISICTGGAGLDLGFELAVQGARTVCMVEREAFAVATLVSAMEQGLIHPAPVWSDARTFNGRAWRGAVDGLIGGIPCQPHSLAGKRLGQEDERDLWSDARRIVVQSGAWFVVIENVRGILSSGGAERVWRDLQRLGFEVEGGLFTASEVGASHERERFIILAVADNALRRWSIEPTARERDGCERTLGGRGGDLAGIGLANANGERLEGIGPDAGAQGRADARGPAGLRDGTVVAHPASDGRRTRVKRGMAAKAESGRALSSPPDGEVYLFPPGPGDIDSWRNVLESSPELEPAFRRVADGLASRLDLARVDRLRMLGNGVVWLQAAYAIRTLATRLAARGAPGATRLIRMMEL